MLWYSRPVGRALAPEEAASRGAPASPRDELPRSGSSLSLETARRRCVTSRAVRVQWASVRSGVCAEPTGGTETRHSTLGDSALTLSALQRISRRRDAHGHIGYLYFPSFVIFSVKFPHVTTRSATFYTSICTTVPSTRVRATATRRKLEQAHDISHVLFVRIGSACIV